MRDLLEKYLSPPREGEGGGNGGGQGGGQGDGTGGDDFTYPEGMPDQYRGATAAESFGNLFSAFNETSTRMEGLRTKLAGMPKAPDKPEGYAFAPSDKLKPYFAGEIDKNPALAAARAAFHKAGVPADAFQTIIEETYGPLVDQGLINKPFSAKAEVETFMSETGMDARAATEALTNAASFAQGLSGQLKDVPEKLKPEVDALLTTLTDTAAGNVLLRGLAGRFAESGIRIGGDSKLQGELTEADLKKLDADPRIDPSNRNHPDVNRRFDEDLRKRYDDAYARLAPKSGATW